MCPAEGETSVKWMKITIEIGASTLISLVLYITAAAACQVEAATAGSRAFVAADALSHCGPTWLTLNRQAPVDLMLLA